MNKTDAEINTLIESEDHERFNQHKFTGRTRELMIKLHHMAAREDMVYHVKFGQYGVSKEFKELVLEYRESVRSDLSPLIGDIQKTNFVV